MRTRAQTATHTTNSTRIPAGEMSGGTWEQGRPECRAPRGPDRALAAAKGAVE